MPTDTPPNDVGLTWLDFGAVLEGGTAISCPSHLVDTALDAFNSETGAGEPLRAEVCAIQWADLDFDSGRLMVRGSYWGRTKSGKPRGLTLPMAQVAELRRFRIAQAEELLRLGIRQEDSTTVVVNAWGQPMVPKRLGEAFAAFCAGHNFDATFHSLHHTAAILMLVSGVDPKTAAGRLGHATAAFTMDRYGHYLESADREAAHRIGEMLS